MPKRIPAILLWMSAATIWCATAMAADPLKVVRTFCRADGLGDRLQPSTWSRIAPLVTWKLEPAWDELRLIRGYEMGTPRRTEDGIAVEVSYTVSADLRAGEVTRGFRLESRTYRLITPDDGENWKIVGPPPVPYLFESEADVDALAELLKPEDSAYVSNSTFVWQRLRRDHPDLPYRSTASLPTAIYLLETEEPKPGDLALFFEGDVAFHVGIVEAEDVVVSATMNAGVWRGKPDLFTGTVSYRSVAADLIGAVLESSPSATEPTPLSATPVARETPKEPSPAISQ